MLFFIPPHTGGDRDFWGEGPDIYLYAELMVWAQRYIWLYIYMQADETTEDWTQARGGQYFLVHKHEKPIKSILSRTSERHFYTDDDHERDWFPFPHGSLFEYLVFVGDTYGNEAGSRTGVQVFLHPITILEAD